MEDISTVGEIAQALSQTYLTQYPNEDKAYIGRLAGFFAMFGYQKGIEKAYREMGDELPAEEIL